jgi:hypothetical protein
MKTPMAIGLTVVVLLFVAVVAFPQTTFQTVTIQDDKGTVDTDTVTLSSGTDTGKDEQVQWASKATNTVYVVFYTKQNHTPFGKAVFEIAPGAPPVPSGKIKKKWAGTAIGYKYAVVGTQGSNDPTVIINR